MVKVKDFLWKPGMSVADFVSEIGNVGFQSVELKNASEVIAKMKRAGAKIYLSFTSNMVTSGLRGFFAQVVREGMAEVIVTTAGAIEEDIMKAFGEKFDILGEQADDVALHQQGENRVGNLVIRTESYMKFEDWMTGFLEGIYAKKKRWAVSEFLEEIGRELGALGDDNSFLYQCSKNGVKLFCPAITDGAIGFHLFIFQQKHDDFIIDVVKDFANIIFVSSYDETKGLIALGGSISKHHAILSGLLNGGFNYAVYMTTAHRSSGSMSGATTSEAKSWGKIKDDSDISTVIGDVSINFPLAMIGAMEKLTEEGLLEANLFKLDSASTEMEEEVKRWINSAKDDLRKAKDNFNISNYDLTSFLSHQSVEKSLKAILIKRTKKFPRIHDLVRLGKIVGLDDDMLKDCEELTFVYTETRYPDASTRKYTKNESQEDINIAERILKWVEDNL
jgi:deoxyhypusine synthase